MKFTRSAGGGLATCVVVGCLAAFPTTASGSGLRPCGSFSPGAPNHVYATPDVSCAQARRLMRKLLAGSPECYPHGPTDHPRCIVEGFHCSAYPVGPYLSRGDCVHHGKRVHGDIEA
jgi:hypothetical protein